MHNNYVYLMLHNENIFDFGGNFGQKIVDQSCVVCLYTPRVLM